MIFVDPVLYRKVKNHLHIMGPYYREPIDFIDLWFNMRTVVDKQVFCLHFYNNKVGIKLKLITQPFLEESISKINLSRSI